ncbi:tail fiber assembly protein [Yersinia frederiksenii]|uniref:tail fiber assembly protein n=1 Tax=Yersinia frederiksenii TaxID=29484 RepID=UPI0025AA35B4|nr:tail fiber assembly protein [Yersinia frederiksenii]MDN0120682.1 tail fiber assembly protein [Yersinia frederiksenii]
MNSYIYSPALNSFFPESLRDDYVSAGSWPIDAINVSESTFNQFINAPVGKERCAGSDGLPCWVDVPPPTPVELSAQAEHKKGELMSLANNAIGPLQDAVDLEMATNDEIIALKAWKTYRVLLSRISPSKAPEIEWPVAPE